VGGGADGYADDPPATSTSAREKTSKRGRLKFSSTTLEGKSEGALRGGRSRAEGRVAVNEEGAKNKKFKKKWVEFKSRRKKKK